MLPVFCVRFFLNVRGLEIPYTSFGSVTSDDLFCEKEQALFDFYERSKTRYGRALDIGANIGVHTMLMVRNGWEVRSFEPDKYHFTALVENCARNGLLPLQFNQQAVSNRNGSAEFTRVIGNTTGSHLKGMKSPYGELETVLVEVVSAWLLLAGADFAKVDAEGAEADIVGCLDASMRCDLMVEIGSEDNAKAIYAHLQEIGRKSFAQKNEWREVKSIEDVPKHHSEGALFIGDWI